jgi:polysaccharide export outer membrane protein
MNFSSMIKTCLLLLLVGSLFCSCSKQLRYFNDLPDSTVVHLKSLPQQERIIQVGDRLQITIGAFNDASAEVFNKYGGSLTGGGLIGAGSGSGGQSGGNETAGYLVDAHGEIEFPIIGKVKAQGLTADGLKKSITDLVAEYLKDPLVSVKFFLFKFTVLGEVRSPGTFTLPMQRTTILDALGAARDLPPSAKRYDIKVYRDYNGQRTITNIDLRKSAILMDPEMFEVKHNDIIYVMPRDSRFVGEEARFYISLTTVAIGILALLIRYK